MFLAAKFLTLFTFPLTWVAALWLASLLLLRQQAVGGRRLGWLALALLITLGWQPLPDALLRRWESAYAEIPPQASLQGYAGMVVLGGAMEYSYVSQGHTQPQLLDGAERLVAAAAARTRTPDLRIVFTGGDGALLSNGPVEAELAKDFFATMGLSDGRIAYESASRNTYENAIFTARLPGVDPTQRWLLVTSAWHMPRSVATFQKAGWNVTAYPVDFRTGTFTPWTEYSLQRSLEHWHLVLHETVGYLAYQLAGRL